MWDAFVVVLTTFHLIRSWLKCTENTRTRRNEIVYHVHCIVRLWCYGTQWPQHECVRKRKQNCTSNRAMVMISQENRIECSTRTMKSNVVDDTTTWKSVFNVKREQTNCRIRWCTNWRWRWRYVLMNSPETVWWESWLFVSAALSTCTHSSAWREQKLIYFHSIVITEIEQVDDMQHITVIVTLNKNYKFHSSKSTRASTLTPPECGGANEHTHTASLSHLTRMWTIGCEWRTVTSDLFDSVWKMAKRK